MSTVCGFVVLKNDKGVVEQRMPYFSPRDAGVCVNALLIEWFNNVVYYGWSIIINGQAPAADTE